MLFYQYRGQKNLEVDIDQVLVLFLISVKTLFLLNLQILCFVDQLKFIVCHQYCNLEVLDLTFSLIDSKYQHLDYNLASLRRMPLLNQMSFMICDIGQVLENLQLEEILNKSVKLLVNYLQSGFLCITTDIIDLFCFLLLLAYYREDC